MASGGFFFINLLAKVTRASYDEKFTTFEFRML
jgi:hypothetical protein